MLSSVLKIGFLLFQTPTYREHVEASWQVNLPSNSAGYSAILTTNPNETLTNVVEPNIPNAFAIGFDTSNPKSQDPFNADGNIYGRPEREVSLHLNGREIANRLCPEEMKTSQPVNYRVDIDSVVGGSAVTVTVGKSKVYNRFFVPEMKPLEGNWTFGQTDGVQTTRFRKRESGKVIPAETPEHVSVFTNEVNNNGRHRFEKAVDLPQNTDAFGRVVATLTLAPTPQGLDPWDRLAQIWLTDEKGDRYEVLRYITPYRKGWTWKVDLTHLLPILSGKKTFKLECETYAEGWLVSFDLDYYKGALSPRPFQVINLWNGTATLGQPDKFPLTDLLKAKNLDLPTFKKAEFWATVTGHGMSPNSENAAEFHPLWRKLHVGTSIFENNLWKEDNYLNPCRPQGGTWKYDRAGWAPGDVVTPWSVDITKAVKQRAVNEFGYEIQPYENKSPVDGNAARHVIESVVVLYK
ncbi:MAG: hypothetical protein BGO01_12220 [Armatimonadetes bacterium 55-13]|nr:hypothetical protein [Armatimonadota bacterium]OJU63551.1 MAG: hypothetical protein BGO01_12220 [Armatimonadetes bacterium 55-13]